MRAQSASILGIAGFDGRESLFQAIDTECPALNKSAKTKDSLHTKNTDGTSKVSRVFRLMNKNISWIARGEAVF